jgi:anhydro-N-acetylmuramic acid kinase
MPWQSLRERLQGTEGLRVAGVLSGTSADGVDVGLVRLRRASGRWEAPEVEAFRTVPFEEELGHRVRGLLEGASAGVREVALLHRDLGLAFGSAVREVAGAAGWVPDLVASHGQTVWHHDGAEPTGSASLQLGDPSRIAEVAGCPVAADFRAADLAAGGEGAPVSAYADDVVFAGVPRPLCILNLGGIANLTWLGDEGALAFDTGPAGALLDGLARARLGQPMDRDGGAASGGAVREEVVARILRHPFIGAEPPCSTGRDAFGSAWLGSLLSDLEAVPTPDLLASAAEAVARHAVGGLRWLPERPRQLLVAGGGVHHPGVMAALERLGGLPARASQQVGVDPDAREALVFAVLGARLVAGEPVTRATVTGAREGRILGILVPGPAVG